MNHLTCCGLLLALLSVLPGCKKEEVYKGKTESEWLAQARDKDRGTRRQAVIVLANEFRRVEPIATAFEEGDEYMKWDLVPSLYRADKGRAGTILGFAERQVRDRATSGNEATNSSLEVRSRDLQRRPNPNIEVWR